MPMPYQRRRRPPDYPIRITLDCHCTIPARVPPLRPTYTYGCTAGLGHGYRRRWVSYTEDGRTSVNRELGASGADQA